MIHPARVRRLTLTNFRNYHAAHYRDRRGAAGAGRAERRRQDQSDRGHFVAGARARPAAGDARRIRLQRGRRFVGGRRRSRRRARARHARHRHRAAVRDDARDAAQMPDRPRAGRLGLRFRRSPAHALAGAGDGRAVHRSARPNAGAFSIGWCSRSMPSTAAASTHSNARCARATGCWRNPVPIRIGSMPSSTKPPSSRSRWRRCGPRRCGGCKARSRPARTLPSRRPKSRSTAGWRSSSRDASRRRDRGPLSRGAARQSRARRRRRPHARWSAPDRPAGDLRTKNIAAADASTGEQKALLIGLVLAHARSDRRHDGLRAGAAARRGCRASRSRRAASRSTTELAQLGAQVWMTGADPALSPRSQMAQASSMLVPAGSRPDLTEAIEKSKISIFDLPGTNRATIALTPGASRQ